MPPAAVPPAAAPAACPPSCVAGSWTSTPAKWSHNFFDNLFGYGWDLVKRPAGAWQWTPTDPAVADDVPDAHVKGKRHAPMMFTTDIALRMDPIYRKISKRFQENPKEFEEAFAKSWFKLTHRDMGPVSRLLGPDVAEPQLWQDPVPPVDHELIGEADITQLKDRILHSGLYIPQLIWVSSPSAPGPCPTTSS